MEKLFGGKARDALEPLGGVEKVAIALSESQTIEDFGAALHLMRYTIYFLIIFYMKIMESRFRIGIKD